MVGIDVGSDTLKVAEVLYRPTGPVLKAVGVIDIPEQAVFEGRFVDEPLMAEILRNVLHSSGVTGKDAVAAVGGRSLFVREVSLPAMNKQELSEAVSWEMEKYLPGGRDSYFYDYAVVHADERNQRIQVLVTAALQEKIRSLLNLLAAVDLRPVAIEVEPLALWRTLAAGDGQGILVDIGAETSRILSCRDGGRLLHRLISIGGEHFLRKNQETDFYIKNDQAVEELAREIHLTLGFFRNQGCEAGVQDLIFTGGGVLNPSFQACIGLSLGLSQLKIHNPLTKMSMIDSLDRVTAAVMAPRLSVVVGLALNGADYD